MVGVIFVQFLVKGCFTSCRISISRPTLQLYTEYRYIRGDTVDKWLTLVPGLIPVFILSLCLPGFSPGTPSTMHV